MPQVVTAGPANGWYGSSLFGAGGFGAAGGSFPNQFGGGFNTGPNGSAWGNETFVPPAWGSGSNAGTGLPGSSPFHQASPSFGYSGYGAPQSYAPSSFGYGGFGGYSAPQSGGFGGGGSALSGGYGAPASPGSIGGGSSGGLTFGPGGGSFGGGPSFGGGADAGLGQAQQPSALSGSFGSGGSPQSLAMAESLGLSPAEFSTLYGQQQSQGQQQVNPANLPSQFASETNGGFSTPYSLAQVIQSEAGDSQQGQFGVASVLANRANNPAFAQYGDLVGQANAPGQFAGHLESPSGPGGMVSPSQVSASAQQIAQALQNGTLGNLGQLGNALYFLAQSSQGGAQMARGGGTPMGGGTVQTNNVFSNVLSPQGPGPGYSPPQYTLGNYAQAQADPFGTAYAGVPYSPGLIQANFGLSGFPILQSGANGYGYPAGGVSTMSDSLLSDMGFNTSGDYTTQLLGQMGYGDAGYGGGSSQSDNSNSSSAVPAYTYGNDIGNNPSDYSNIGDYSPSYGADFGTGGVTDLGSFDSSGASFDSSGSSVDSGGY